MKPIIKFSDWILDYGQPAKAMEHNISEWLQSEVLPKFYVQVKDQIKREIINEIQNNEQYK